MFNSIVLDTVIGLVFIFLLYSLLATILGEMIANFIGLRARMLRQALERLLNDDYEIPSVIEEIRRIRSTQTVLVKPAAAAGKQGTDAGSHKSRTGFLKGGIRSWIERTKPLRHLLKQWVNLIIRIFKFTIQPLVRALGSFFLFEFKDFNDSVAGIFYQQPSVKYLAKGPKKKFALFRKAKPSYIRTENFSETLIRMLKTKGTGETPMQKIGFCLKYNTLNIQPDTLAHINSLYEDSGNDPEKFRKQLNDWYNEMMERLGGWFKRKIQLILFLIGMVIAIAFNVDSIAIVKKLAKDKTAREQMVTLATKESQAGSATATALERSQDSTVRDSLLRESYRQVREASDDAGKILGLGWDFPKLVRPCSHEFLNTTLIACWNYTVKDPRCPSVPGDTNASSRFSKLLNEWFLDPVKEYREIIKSEKSDSLRKLASSALETKLASMDDYLEALNYFGDTRFILVNSIDFKDRNHSIVQGERQYTMWEKIGYIFQQTWLHKLMLLGFIITALAISLGSNFWFDLLKKLVSIRGSGVNPDETKTEPKKEPGAQVQAEGVEGKTVVGGFGAAPESLENPVDVALRIYGEQIRNEQGVLSVGKGYSKPAEGETALTDRLQVSVTDEDTAVRVRSKYGRLRISEQDFIDIDILVTGTPKLSGRPASDAANPSKAIANANELFGWGSFGCLVRDRFEPSKVFVLSCYHVMNGNYSWNNDGRDRRIQNINGPISDGYQGFLNNSLDIAYAGVDEKGLEYYKTGIDSIKPKNIRAVTVDDVFKTKIKIEGLSTKMATGMIVNNSKSVSFNYYSGPRQYFSHQIDDLIVISHKDPDNPGFLGTKDGDSGSVVLDSDDNAIGIVVGSDLIHTYAMKITTVFDLLGMELEI